MTELYTNPWTKLHSWAAFRFFHSTALSESVMSIPSPAGYILLHSNEPSSALRENYTYGSCPLWTKWYQPRYCIISIVRPFPPSFPFLRMNVHIMDLALPYLWVLRTTTQNLLTLPTVAGSKFLYHGTPANSLTESFITHSCKFTALFDNWCPSPIRNLLDASNLCWP